MGAFFKLDHANIMAFVTSRSYGAPRVRRRDLEEFLDSLAYDARRYLITEPAFEPWPEEIAIVASRYANLSIVCVLQLEIVDVQEVLMSLWLLISYHEYHLFLKSVCD